MLFLVLNVVSATGLVSPAKVSYINILPGCTVSKTIYFQNAGNAGTLTEIIPEGEISSWISTEIIERGIPGADGMPSLEIMTHIPDDTEQGRYGGGLTLAFTKDATIGGYQETYIERINIDITIGEDKIKGIKLHDVDVKKSDVDSPSAFMIDIENLGNTDVEIDETITINGPEDRVIKNKERFLPFEEKNILIFDDPFIIPGNYSADVTVAAGDFIETSTKSFIVEDKGDLIRKIDIQKVSIDKTAKPDEKMQIYTTVKNVGEVATEIRPIHTISTEEGYEKRIIGKSTVLAAGEIARLTTKFIADAIDAYQIDTHVAFENTITDSIKTNFVVTDEPDAVALSTGKGPLFILIVALLFGTRTIIKKKIQAREHGA
ncbi:hypothetical protein COV93_05325 [Candidatus Woesearchaeota archaeon CG11_big_fil_rev_8_21_14_0_20_43_8]|nr:MAG: hypothetical protein COV93_05325 [Candidatus Woesearchaeota archaeon CG11_big_fil_rev_8_21_14_0_20_43_8]PIO07065.1 MAG: hypothetical protein COT47_01655 [Candidatus Woesearchaeota archaeon CG08_land_8_20_14_0_20_43_7]